MRWRQRVLIVLGVIVTSAIRASGQIPDSANATLTGVIRDSTGTGISGVDVILTGTTRAIRSDDAGRFTLAGVTPGAYRVWFRRLGYASAQFDWPARIAERTEVNVVLTPIPRTLDPVVVRAQEDKDMSDRASILGIVVDTAGQPIEEAEVQLVGANRSGLTRANGGFLFRPLAVGTYVIRIRKLGFEPNVLTLNLVAGDDREVIVRMRRISAKLDPVVVTARSGYDARDQQIYDDLEKRMQWKSFKNPIFGPEDLRRFQGNSLDIVLRSLLLDRATTHGYPVASIMGGPSSAPPKSRLDQWQWEQPFCILLNGKTPIFQPLHTFTTAEIDLLEVYPPGTELTATVATKMTRPECRSNGILDHPGYVVLWLKGAR